MVLLGLAFGIGLAYTSRVVVRFVRIELMYILNSVQGSKLSEDLHSILRGLLDLLSSFGFRGTEDQLCNQTPVTGQIPLLRNTGVDERVVVLQVGTEAKSLKTSPDYKC